MEDASLLDWLLRQHPLAKRQTLKRMVQAGRVRVNGRRAGRLSQPLAPSDVVEVAGRQSAEPSKAISDAGLSFEILHEDADLLVVNKPAGLLTSTVPRERRPTLLADVRAYVAQREPRARVGLIHRLDRDASGLLIFSKNDAAYQSLKSQFFHHSVTREYLAVVRGTPNPSSDRIENRLSERTDGTVHATRQAGRGQVAISEYQVLNTQKRLSLVRVTLHTGRKHQIRVHLAGRGTPVVGDAVYGPPGQTPSRLMLAAVRLVTTHPATGKPLQFQLPAPAEFPLREAMTQTEPLL